MNQARNVLQFTIWYQITEKGKIMEDRYLFKAKRLDNGEWVQGVPFEIEGKTVILINDNENYLRVHYLEENMWNAATYAIEVNPSTICQCTGLEDRNGNLIWENDILVGYLDDNYPQNATYEMVLWNKSGFCTKEQGSNDISELGEFDQKNFEVCGNIIDNPELFESEDNITESEAIKELQENIDLPFGSNVSKEAAKISMQALEKQIPKKPIKSEKQVIRYVNTYCCPICKGLMGTGIAKWCYHCGQKLDWSDTV